MSMAKITFKTAGTFKKIYDITNSLGMPVEILPMENRILTIGIDTTKVVGVRISIPESELLEYEVSEDYLNLPPEKRIIALDHRTLKPIMKKAKKSEPLTIEVLENDMVKVEIGDKRKTRVKVAPINVDYNEIPEEAFDQEFGGTVKVYGKLIKDVLSVVRDVSGEIRIKALKDGLQFEGGNDVADLDILIPYDDPMILEAEADIGTNGLYGVSYLLSVAKAIDNGDVVTMEFGEEQPLKLDMPIGEEGVFTVVIAPRVDVE